jgi:hypothetical protein
MTRLGIDQARRIWDELSPEQRFELGDQLVRLPGAINELDRLRMLWESQR